MLLIYLFTVLVALAGGFAGHQPLFRMDRINRSAVIHTILACMALFTLLMTAYLFGLFPHSVAAPFMMSVYSFLGGFFTGYAIRLIQLRGHSGRILYMHRSFWIDHAPNLAAMIIILFGIYRTSLITELPVTGIRLTSGLSLMTFGLFAWTVRIVPEFRSHGILFLDSVIAWKQVIAWNWYSEEVVSIEYLHQPEKNDEEVRIFQTTIPAQDRKEFESILKLKMEDHRDEREKLLQNPDSVLRG